MNNSIKQRATSYSLSSRFQRTPLPPILHHQHRHHLQPPIQIPPTPRPISTTHPLAHVAPQYTIYLPKDHTLPTTEGPLYTILQTQGSTLRTVFHPVTTHHDLPSYLNAQHTRFVSLPTPEARRKLTTSFVYLGTRYEYLIQAHLQKYLGFTLTRIGGKGDEGVDLIGSWTLPVPLDSASSSSPSSSPTNNDTNHPTPPQPTFRVLLQAKRFSPHRNPSPAQLRELDGTVHSSSTSRWINAAFAMHSVRTSAQAQSQSPNTTDPTNLSPDLHTNLSRLPTLGLLVTTRPLTTAIEKAMASSARSLMYVCLEEVEDKTVMDGDRHDGGNELPLALKAPLTRIRQMAWNAAARRDGLEGYDVVAKHSENDDGVFPGNGEAIMMFQGQPVRPPW